MYIKRRGPRRLPGYSLGWALSKGKRIRVGDGVRETTPDTPLPPPINPPKASQAGDVSPARGIAHARGGSARPGHAIGAVIWRETRRWVRAYGTVAVKCMETARRGTGAGRFVRITRDEAETVCFMVVSWGLCVGAMVAAWVVKVGRGFGLW